MLILIIYYITLFVGMFIFIKQNLINYITIII